MNARSEASKGTTLPPAPAALAAKLRAATQAGLGFYDPAVRKLRSELAQALRSVLLEDYATAQVRRSKQHIGPDMAGCMFLTTGPSASFYALHQVALCACRNTTSSRRCGRSSTTAPSKSSAAASASPQRPATVARSRCARWIPGSL